MTDAAAKGGTAAVMVRPRLYLGGAAIGPGKVDLLRLVGETRSISAAARRMGMTYKRASLLLAALNDGLGQPVIATSAGGKGGGGAQLTPFGEQLIARYSELEERLNAAAGPELEALRALLDCVKTKTS